MKPILLAVLRTSVLLPLLCISALPAYSQDTSESTLQDTLTLEEAVVIARRTRHQADGYTVNLRSSDIVRGKTTSDALVFLPGVSRQGSVYRISGIDVSEIYVDGMKLTSFDELDNIPGRAADAVRMLSEAGIGISYLYSFLLAGKGILIFRTDNPVRTGEVIAEKGLQALNDVSLRSLV